MTEDECGKPSATSFFGQERLLEIAQANLGHSAQDIQDVLLAGVHELMGDAPQFDDITLVIVRLEAP